MDLANKVGFAIGTGRCGTLFLHRLIDMEPAAASSHERNPDNEAFHRYCKWNALPVDDEGFLAEMEKGILTDLEIRCFSFEASPYLSLSVKELRERFMAKFIFLIRRPDRVVTSFVHKGFYAHPYNVKNTHLAAGYQDQRPEKVHTFFARVAPRGDFFRTWNEMTRVGKVAWFWKAWNESTLQLLRELPAESYRIVRIEDLDYSKYLELSQFLGFKAAVARADFEFLRADKPHAFWSKRNIDEWSEVEIEQFESQVREMAEMFGYEYRVLHLIDEIREEKKEAMRLGHLTPPGRRSSRFLSLRRMAAGWLNRIAQSIDVTWAH